MLREKFGQKFVEYCRTCAEIWPRLRNFHTSAQLPVNIRGLRAEAVDVPAGSGYRCSAKWSRICGPSNGGRGFCTCPNEQRLRSMGGTGLFLS